MWVFLQSSDRKLDSSYRLLGIYQHKEILFSWLGVEVEGDMFLHAVEHKLHLFTVFEIICLWAPRWHAVKTSDFRSMQLPTEDRDSCLGSTWSEFGRHMKERWKLGVTTQRAGEETRRGRIAVCKCPWVPRYCGERAQLEEGVSVILATFGLLLLLLMWKKSELQSFWFNSWLGWWPVTNLYVIAFLSFVLPQAVATLANPLPNGP